MLIENQYGRSDHDHFGKLLTYASGLKAATVVLICEHLREEHRTALTWLNSITGEGHAFFAVELELWRIDQSPIAPRFNVVVKPDDWARLTETARRSDAQGGELSDLQKTYLRYWGAFRDYLQDMNDLTDNARLRPRKPLPQTWTTFAIGRANIGLTGSVNSQAKWIRAELTLYGSQAPEARLSLLDQRAEIEAELGYVLDWDELRGTQQAIRLTQPDQDPTDPEAWKQQHAWLYERLNDLHRVFHDRIKALA
ncbi:MAG: DUF4268 domain-containing protein [Paracoccaceae bacterium]